MKDIGKLAASLGKSEVTIPGTWTMPTIEECHNIFYHMFPGSWVRSPFEIRNYASYKVIPKQTGPLNPCGEIKLPWKGWCRLGFREVDSPFNLTSFTEPYYVRGTIDDYPD